MANFTGTPNNDTIDGTYANGFHWGDNIFAEGGNDFVTLSPGVGFVSGPGNDTITGQGGGALAFWGAPGPVVVNLPAGWVQDGYGGIDTVLGTITELHLPGAGATVTGTDTAETVFCFGGNALIDLAGGSDRVNMYQLDSAGYTIRQFGDRVVMQSSGGTVEVRNVETLAFADRTFSIASQGDGPFFQFRYDVESFVETERSPGWWYAGEYNEPQLVSYFPQAVSPIDIGADGDDDLIIPLNRGYRTGVDTRYHFQVLENVDGIVTFHEAMTEATPFIAGSRRTETIWLERFGSLALVTVAHDTAIETETRTDIPWRFGDISITLADPFDDVTAQLVPADTLPKASVTGRDTAVDAHSLAVGDVNGDGMDDILVGEFSGPYVLLQTESGAFNYFTSPLLQSLATTWKEPTLANATHPLLIDLHLADLDGDHVDDLVVGWGHGTGLSRVFFNDGHGGFSAADSTPLPVSVYGASNTLHMKTMSGDFDKDGDTDLVILQSRNDPYYGGNYLQFLENDGEGGFTDATTARFGDPALLSDTFGERLHWTDFWQVLDVNGDGALDIAGHTVDTFDATPFLYINDGAGHFDRIEVPGQVGRPVAWGDYDGDGNIEVVTFDSTWNDAAGTSSTNTFSVYEMVTPHPDHAVAYDLGGHAGTVAKILGAVFGKEAVSNAAYAGIGLSLADGGMDAEALFALALDAALGGARSNGSVVDLLYTNVVGAAPSPDVRAGFVSMIETGGFTQVSLGWMAAEHPLNLANIGFTGLQQNGLEYLPVA